MNKIMQFGDKHNINHTLFNLLFALLAILGLYWLYVYGVATGDGIGQIVGANAISVTIYLVTGFTAIYFLGGVGLKVWDKIFVEGNIAVAIAVGAFLVGLSNVIRGGFIGRF